MKRNYSLPLDNIEITDGELEMVLGGHLVQPMGLGSGCNCSCPPGNDGGWGVGCNCECNVKTAAPESR